MADKPWHTGKEVEKLLEATGRSVNDVATPHELGMTYATVYRWFKAAKWPRRHLIPAARYFGVNTDWLETGRGSRHVETFSKHGFANKHIERQFLRLQADLELLMARFTRRLVDAGKLDDDAPLDTVPADPYKD